MEEEEERPCRHKRIVAMHGGIGTLHVLAESTLIEQPTMMLLHLCIPPSYLPSPLAWTLNMLVVVHNRYIT
jgi:hypothetical protein